MKFRIGTKLLGILLLTALLPLLVAGWVSYRNTETITQVAADANRQIADLAMTDSTAALYAEQQAHLESRVQNIANEIDQILVWVEADTAELADFATYLYNNPDSFNRYPSPSVYQFVPEHDVFGSVVENENSWMGIFGDGVDENGEVSPDTMAEIYLTEFMDLKYKGIAANNPYAVQLYLNTKSQMSRGMPFIDGEYIWVNAAEEFSRIPDVTVFDFYYLADEVHNPARIPVWTELYWDPAGLGWMVSCVAPAYRNGTELMGVAGIDITLGKMIEQVVNVKLEETGFAFLMSQNGQAIAFPERGADFLDFTDSFEGNFGDNEQFSLMLTESNDAVFQDIIETMLAGEYALTTYIHPDNGEEYFFAYHPIKLTGWSVGLVVPVEEVIAPALATNRQISTYTNDTLARIATESQQTNTTFIWIVAGIILLVVLVAILFSRSISNPIHELDEGSRRIGTGDLAHRITVKSGDEIEDLSQTFNQMATDLQANIEQLETANLELKKLDELKSQFISMASHELRTPLIAIQGYVDLLRDKPERLNVQQQAMLATVSRNTNRLTRIVAELLDISRIEENKLILRQEAFWIEPLIIEILDEQRPSLEKRKHTTTVEIDSDLRPVLGDRDRIAQVIINLLGNAIKYTPDGGQIQLKAQLDKPDFMRLEISDNGIGILTEDIDRLFQRFSTLNDVTKHKTGKDEFLAGGTGLGLSIVKGIVVAHGGDVWVTSQIGEGTTFYVTLPLADEAMPVAPKPESSALETTIYKSTSFTTNGSIHKKDSRLNILFIDDEDDAIAVTEQLLADHYTVTGANTSATGIKQAIESQPDLILLDAWMPGISGYNVCKTLKRNSNTSHIPIVIFTAAVQPADEAKAKAVGADGFISKPFKKQILIDLIESFRTAGKAEATT